MKYRDVLEMIVNTHTVINDRIETEKGRKRRRMLEQAQGHVTDAFILAGAAWDQKRGRHGKNSKRPS